MKNAYKYLSGFIVGVVLCAAILFPRAYSAAELRESAENIERQFIGVSTENRELREQNQDLIRQQSELTEISRRAEDRATEIERVLIHSGAEFEIAIGEVADIGELILRIISVLDDLFREIGVNDSELGN